jgi:hypothetical protein
MPGSPPVQIEADRECLLQPLHDRGQLQPIGRLDVKRQPLFYKSKPPKFKGKTPPHFANTRQKTAIVCHRRNSGSRLLTTVRTSYQAS